MPSTAAPGRSTGCPSMSRPGASPQSSGRTGRASRRCSIQYSGSSGRPARSGSTASRSPGGARWRSCASGSATRPSAGTCSRSWGSGTTSSSVPIPRPATPNGTFAWSSTSSRCSRRGRTRRPSPRAAASARWSPSGRALMSSPRLLVVDEPTIGLAPKVCLEISKALRRMNEELGITILITEQNVNFAVHLAEEVHVLETGENPIERDRGRADEQPPRPGGVLRTLTGGTPLAPSPRGAWRV